MSYKRNTNGAVRSIRKLERDLAMLAGRVNSDSHRMLTVLAEFDSRQGYVECGLKSCAHWLSWRCGIGLVAAREKVRVARALRDLPLISDSMRRGALSYCKVRALTRVATQESEQSLLAFAETSTVAHVEKIVRMMRGGEPGEALAHAKARQALRKVKAYVARDGCIIVEGKLSAEEGAPLLEAMRVAEEEIEVAERVAGEASEPSTAQKSSEARFADALVWIAQRFLARGRTLPVADRHIVHLRVDERVLREAQADGREQNAVPLAVAPATAKRWCCDGNLIAVVEGSGGKRLRIGQRTRVVPPVLRRALVRRDGGCRYPGCKQMQFVEAHHIEHWADGGKTSLGNLVLLCRRHHLFMHECGYRVVQGSEGLRFEQPDGRPVSDDPSHGPFDTDTRCA